MNARRSLVASFAALAVAWTALAPFTTALRESSGEMPLCHQAGMQVDAASSPLPAAPGQAPERKTHCPLCVMVFFAAFAPEAVVPSFHVTAAERTLEHRVAQLRHLLVVALPQGRAPPVSLPA
ncbi:MAG TPA: DUF2946 family protein [Usitatibacter sp.]|nr:DUF2946 family protein [Usitatibacter sp.]